MEDDKACNTFELVEHKHNPGKKFTGGRAERKVDTLFNLIYNTGKDLA